MPPNSNSQVADARVGDTITLKRAPAEQALPGYTEAMPMVFCGLFPTGAWWAGWRERAGGRERESSLYGSERRKV